jgi:hypothetical protein
MPEHLTFDDDEATHQRRRCALHVYTGKHEVRRRRPDVDSDRRQLDMIGQPDGGTGCVVVVVVSVTRTMLVRDESVVAWIMDHVHNEAA